MEEKHLKESVAREKVQGDFEKVRVEMEQRLKEGELRRLKQKEEKEQELRHLKEMADEKRLQISSKIDVMNQNKQMKQMEFMSRIAD